MRSSKFYMIFITLLLSFAVLTTGCTSAPTATAPQPTKVEIVEATPVPPTQAPTQTQPVIEPTATATAIPATETPTPIPTLGASESLGAWCLPDGMSPSEAKDPANPPGEARFFEVVEGALEVNNLPYSICTFVYTFAMPAQSGLKLAVYELTGKSPWLTLDLIPLDGQPNQVAASTRHTYIIAPPYYDLSYNFALIDASGNELRRDQVNVHRWKPELCWNGIYPSLKTGLCNRPLDLHPWDPGYGTPIPTFPPDKEW